MAVQRELQRRRSASNVFAGRHGFITPRDLFRCGCGKKRAAAGAGSKTAEREGRTVTSKLSKQPCLAHWTCPVSLNLPASPHYPWLLCRWAGRGAVGYQQLAEDGFAVLGERLRSPEERAVVGEVLRKVLGAQVRLGTRRVGGRGGCLGTANLKAWRHRGRRPAMWRMLLPCPSGYSVP